MSFTGLFYAKKARESTREAELHVVRKRSREHAGTGLVPQSAASPR
jgi:hypothetical protein